MVHAFVMVQTAAGDSEPVRDRLTGLEGVVEAHVVAGEYDIIAEVDAGDVRDVLRAVSTEMQSIEGVVGTKTYISLEE